MRYCVKCGAQVEEGANFCPDCGEPIPHMEENRDFTQEYTYYDEPQRNGGQDSAYYVQPDGEYFDQAEVKKNKAMGVLSYIGILVLIPLLAGDKRCEYVKHHANQGLILFLLGAIIDLLDGEWVWGLHSWINFGSSWFSWLFNIADFAVFILMVMGIVSACKGTRRELPLIGKIKFIK